MLRKVIKLTAWHSPNVRFPDAEPIPGIIDAKKLATYERMWDDRTKRIKLHAEFPGDAESLLFPEEWERRCILRHRELMGGRQEESGLWVYDRQPAKRNHGLAMGIDPGEGGAHTVWAIGDHLGLIRLVAEKTKNTATIPYDTIDLAREHGVAWERVVFDRGGGGKQAADKLRQMGHQVRTVAFNDKPELELKRGLTKIEDRRDHREEKSIYRNVRVEMYWKLAEIGAPVLDAEGAIIGGGWGIPGPEEGDAYERLWKQLGPVPRQWDKNGEGIAILPPKAEMIAQLYNGEFSPDEADAVVLCVFGLTHKSSRSKAGAS